LMEIEWVTIPDFPDYLISNQGDVLNKSSGRWLHKSYTKEGAVKVGLVRLGKQYTRSVKVLVAESFVPGKDETFNTPIHLDGNEDHNSEDNIVWRPRWFAWKYTNQFHNVTENDHIGPLREIATDIRYYDIYQAAISNGLLFVDIRKSIALRESVFPTFQRFEMM
jgi:hypothetical protein